MPTEAKKGSSVTKEFVSQLLTALNGVTCPLDEPYKTHFEALKANYNSVLEALPPSDMVPAANEANWNLGTLLSCMMSAQNLVSGMGNALNEMKSKMGAALDSINSKVEAAMADKVKLGELVPKDTATALCSAARAAGVEEGKLLVQGEVAKRDAAVKLVGDRKALVTRNGLPLPEKDELLAGTEDEFAALQAKAKNRIDVLKGKGLALNSSLMAKAWLADAEYGTFEALVGETMGKRGGGEPFLPGAPANSDKPPGGMF